MDLVRHATLDEQLKDAITTKHLIEIEYKNSIRIVEPHDYGTQKSVDTLLAYQRRTLSGKASASDRGWRLFEVAKITQCTVLDAGFHGSRADAHHRHYVWDVIYARVP